MGRRLGAYQVTQELGRGGMGAVYLAVRADDEYRKHVAVKLIRAGADDPEIRRRFLIERQILANLEHPNIARLLDGGTSDDDLPFVVMEYVDGERLDTYCDRRQLTVEARLRLFRRVCDAVQFWASASRPGISRSPPGSRRIPPHRASAGCRSTRCSWGT